MKIKLTEEQYKRVILKEESNSDSYPCSSKQIQTMAAGNLLKMFCKKNPHHAWCKEKGEKLIKTDTTELKSDINKEIEELINGTELKRILGGVLFLPPSKYPTKVNKRWVLYSNKLDESFPYKSGYISNNILTMRFMIPHGYGGVIKKLVGNLSLPNYISISFITDGSKDCYSYGLGVYGDCDDIKITIDLNKKGGCSKSDFANMVIDGKPLSLGVDKNYIQLKPY